MHVDMSCFHRYHTLILIEQRVYDRGISLRAASEKEDVGTVVLAGFHYLLFCPYTAFVIAVWVGDNLICVHKMLEHIRVGTIAVVIVE